MDTRERWNVPRVGNAAAWVGIASAISLALLAAEPATERPLPAAPRAASSEEASFLDLNRSAMTTMMSGMAIKPTGDVDRDFVHMMVPHHQGAIDMAMAVLRYGHDPVVRRLAQEIIVTQQEEIAAMRRAVGEALPASVPPPVSSSQGATSKGRH
jgi:hypothetical protein